MMKLRNAPNLVALTGLAVGSLGVSGAAHAQIEILALENQQIPGISGQFYDGIGTPVIDDTGDVHFFASWGAGFDRRALMINRGGETSILIQDGSVPVGLGFDIDGFVTVAVSPAGLSQGVAFVTTPDSNSNTDAIVIVSESDITAVHLDGDDSPVSEGQVFIRQDALAFGRDGTLVYTTQLANTAGGASDNRSLIAFDATGTYREVVREGDPVPGDPLDSMTGSCGSSLRIFCTPRVTGDGRAVFIAEEGIFTETDAGLRAVALDNQPVPGGSLSSWSIPKTNAQGDVAFSADVRNNSSFDDVYLERDGVLLRAPLGQPAPTSAGGTFGSFRTPISTRVDLSDSGEVLFFADTLEPLQGSNRIGDGLFVFDGQSLRAVFRSDEPAPGGGFFRDGISSDDWVIGANGHVVFRAVTGGDGQPSRTALFLNTPNEGTRRLLTIGDEIEGRTVTGISTVAAQSSSATGINADGVIAARVEFDSDLRAIIRIGEAPEPCLADVNNDGSVNGLDFGAWLSAFNVQSPAADQNGDGAINGLDFGAWLSNFNAGCD